MKIVNIGVIILLIALLVLGTWAVRLELAPMFEDEYYGDPVPQSSFDKILCIFTCFWFALLCLMAVAAAIALFVIMCATIADKIKQGYLMVILLCIAVLCAICVIFTHPLSVEYGTSFEDVVCRLWFSSTISFLIAPIFLPITTIIFYAGKAVSKLIP